MENLQWVVLVYKVPSQPTKYRATVWREIKRLGGIYLQDGVCIFPDLDDVSLNVSALAARIRQMDGTEYMFYTDSSTKEQVQRLVEQFQEQRRGEYVNLLEKITALESAIHLELDKSLPHKDSLLFNDAVDSELPGESHLDRLKRLQKEYNAIKMRDYFKQPLTWEVGQKLQDVATRVNQLIKAGESS